MIKKSLKSKRIKSHTWAPLRHDFQAITRPRIFLRPMSSQDTGRRLQGNIGIVSLIQFKKTEM
jgi:hypothetical protein